MSDEKAAHPSATQIFATVGFMTTVMIATVLATIAVRHLLGVGAKGDVSMRIDGCHARGGQAFLNSDDEYGGCHVSPSAKAATAVTKK